MNEEKLKYIKNLFATGRVLTKEAYEEILKRNKTIPSPYTHVDTGEVDEEGTPILQRLCFRI